MVQLIIGVKGKGKTKVLLDRVNQEIAGVNGSGVYLDKDKQHMFEVSRKVRLIDVTDFQIEDTDEFIGFLLGIISQDHDLEKVYIDSFLNVAKTDADHTGKALDRIAAISEKYSVDFMIALSVEKSQLPEKYVNNVISE
jgi:hypothetical protein